MFVGTYLKLDNSDTYRWLRGSLVYRHVILLALWLSVKREDNMSSCNPHDIETKEITILYYQLWTKLSEV